MTKFNFSQFAGRHERPTNILAKQCEIKNTMRSKRDGSGYPTLNYNSDRQRFVPKGA
jgi:hypothetical protein